MRIAGTLFEGPCVKLRQKKNEKGQLPGRVPGQVGDIIIYVERYLRQVGLNC